jgi:hypothetical protein
MVATMDDPKQIPISELKSEDGAEELVRSEAMKPYLDLILATMSGRDSTAAMEALAALPLEKRYVWRVASALKWAFADSETMNVEADRQTLSVVDQRRLLEELRLRPLQFCLFLSALVGPNQMAKLMVEAIKTARSIAGAGG